MGNWAKLTLYGVVVVVVLSIGGVREAQAQVCSGVYGGTCPATQNICPVGWYEDYEMIQHQPPSIYSVVSRCGGQEGMIWAEMPESEEDLLFAPEHVNNLRVRFGYHQGTLVTVETQIPLRALTTFSKAIGALETIKGAPIDHIDIVYSPGHWGLPEPHYDVQEHLVEHAAHQAFECQPTKGGWFQFLKVSE